MPEPPRKREVDWPIVVLLIMIALAIGGWYVINHLWDASKIQDCVQSGRRNCGTVIEER